MKDATKCLLVGSLLLLGAVACTDLEVTNLNDADATRALETPGDVESLIAGSYNSWWGGLKTYSGPGLFLSNQAFQHNAPWNNAGMEEYGRLPRVGIVNDVAHNFYEFFARAWYRSYRALAAVADGLNSLDDPEVAGALDPEDLARDRAFARFMQGLAHGTVAAMYDRGFVVDENTDIETVLEPVGHDELMEAALGFFEEAIALSEANSFQVPNSWARADLTNEDLARLAHSYMAIFRAMVARTPEERASVDWNAVISDVDAGIQTDFVMTYDPSEGQTWYNGFLDYATWPNWNQLAYFIYGMADPHPDRVYDDWLALGLDAKSHTLADGTPVLIVTPDLRFPQGSTVEEQRANPGRYFRITSAAQQGDTWQKPERGVWRWSWYKAGYGRGLDYGWLGVVDQAEIYLPELRLLKAEGLFRQGDFAGAAAIVNETRVAADLSPTDESGTNTSCVPRLPDGTCGDLWEMLKWEKRMETVWTGLAGAGWFFDSRGWGDLWKDTPLQFPIPCRELQVLGLLPCNTYGGPGGEMGAPVSTYAWPNEG